MDVVGQHQQRRVGGPERQALGRRARNPRRRAGLPEAPQGHGRSPADQPQPRAHTRRRPGERGGGAEEPQAGAPDHERPRHGVRIRAARQNDRPHEAQRGGLEPEMREPPSDGTHAGEAGAPVVPIIPSEAVFAAPARDPGAVPATHPAPGARRRSR